MHLYMGRCLCILTSGPKKGFQCSNRAKLRSKFCGIHANCQITVASRESRVIATSDSVETIPLFETCPDQLKPIDGQCPQKFPKQRLLPDGSVCCWRKFKTIRKMRKTKIVSELGSLLDTIPHDPMDICSLDDYGITYYPVDELIPLRNLDLSGSDCRSFNQDLMRELPSLDWIKAQREYLAHLSATDFNVIAFYTFHGDVILNNFVRHGWTITEDDIDYIRLYYNSGVVSKVFERWMQTLNLTVDGPVERILIAIYNQLNRIIQQSPINSQRFVSYRGSHTKDYFDQTQMIFQNVGFFSTTLLIQQARSFSKEKFMTKIIVPKGYHCLYLESASRFIGEHEILMADQSQYVISSKFQEQRYGKASIPTNELVMVKAVPERLTADSIPPVSTQIQALIIDRSVRQQITNLIGSRLGIYSDEQDTPFYQLSKLWLRRLADHQIYTLDAFMDRGIQLIPSLTDLYFSTI